MERTLILSMREARKIYNFIFICNSTLVYFIVGKIIENAEVFCVYKSDCRTLNLVDVVLDPYIGNKIRYL